MMSITKVSFYHCHISSEMFQSRSIIPTAEPSDMNTKVCWANRWDS